MSIQAIKEAVVKTRIWQSEKSDVWVSFDYDEQEYEVNDTHKSSSLEEAIVSQIQGMVSDSRIKIMYCHTDGFFYADVLKENGDTFTLYKSEHVNDMIEYVSSMLEHVNNMIEYLNSLGFINR